MIMKPSRLYVLLVGVLLMLQGVSTLAFRLFPALDRAFPILLEQTRMVPPHSLLHIATAMIALWIFLRGGAGGARAFALGFGLFYLGLALVGWASGHQLGLGLQPFDHPFHVLLGGLGLFAIAIESFRGR